MNWKTYFSAPGQPFEPVLSEEMTVALERWISTTHRPDDWALDLGWCPSAKGNLRWSYTPSHDSVLALLHVKLSVNTTWVGSLVVLSDGTTRIMPATAESPYHTALAAIFPEAH